MMGDCSLKRSTVSGRVYTKNDYQYITVNTETKSKTVTSLISRSIKPGYEKDYDDWLRRFLEFERKALGYLGTTVVLPGGTNSNIRYIIRRFTDKASMDIWDNSPDVQRLLQEANRYSTRHYEIATGLETWFMLPNLRPVMPPPRWKMAIVVFVAAYTTSMLSRSLLGFLFSDWPLIASTLIYSTILVISLTYLLLPILSRIFKRWLYTGG
jgi:antibiotic biosynthesis monooxygenase (ABM) superfamily enzyme